MVRPRTLRIPVAQRPLRLAQTTHALSEDEQALETNRLVSELESRLSSPGYRPPMLPVVALKVLELSRKPGTSVPQIVEVLEQDSLLAAQVMRRVRTPQYAGQSDVRSLHDAAVRLGLNAMRDLVLDTAMNARIFRAKHYEPWMEELRSHSSAVARMSRLVTRYAPLEADFSFLCGLLHDVGMGAVLVLLSETMAEPSPAEVVLAVLSHLHEQASGLVATIWQLPPEIALVLGNHHHPRMQGHVHPLVAVLCVAEALCRELELGGDQGLASIDLGSAADFAVSCDALRLTEGMLKQIRAEARAAVTGA